MIFVVSNFQLTLNITKNCVFLTNKYLNFIGSDLVQMNWLLRIIAVEIKMHVHQNLLMTLTKLILLFIGIAEKKNKYIF